MAERLAIVIPTRNEAAYIGQCLESVAAQDLTGLDVELVAVVCDGGSTDATVDIVKSHARAGEAVVLLANERGTSPYAFNLGIQSQNADYSMILGGHSALSHNFVREAVEVLRSRPDVDVVGGLLESAFADTAGEAIGVAMASPFGVGNAHFRTGARDGLVDTVAFGVYRARVFEAVGYFDTELTRNQDDEFNYRVTKAGMKIWLDSQLRCVYYVRATLETLWRQYGQYGYWKVYVNRKHRAVTSIRQLVPALFVLYLALGAVAAVAASLWYPIALTAILAPLFLYVGAAAFAARRSPLRLRTMLAFATLHLSYGIGYLNGVLDFVLLRKQHARQRYSALTR